MDKGKIMTRFMPLLGALVLLVLIGGGAWLAVSPMQPASKMVRVELPDTAFPR
jgi:hypothetical protein